MEKKNIKKAAIIIPAVAAAFAAAIIAIAVVKGRNSRVKGDTANTIRKNAVTEYVNEDAERFGRFTARTSSVLLKGSDKNHLYSPACLYANMCMVASLGRENDGFSSLYKSIGASDKGEIDKLYNKLCEAIAVGSYGDFSGANMDDNADDGPDTDLSSYLLLNGLSIRENARDMLQNCIDNMNLNMFNGDFTAADVNKLAEEKTHGLIKKIVDEEKNMSGRMMIMSILYYKSPWWSKFSEEGKDVFTLSSGEEVEANYISRTERQSSYISGDKYTAVFASLAKGRVVFIQPEGGYGVNDIMEEDVLNEILASVTSESIRDIADVTIRVPEFDISDTFELSIKENADLFYELGLDEYRLSSLCTLGSSNPEINSGDSTYNALQQVNKLNLNKDGIEGGSVTVFNPIIGSRSEKTLKIMVNLNKPFAYIVMCGNVPVFIGTVYNPSYNGAI